MSLLTNQRGAAQTATIVVAVVMLVVGGLVGVGIGRSTKTNKVPSTDVTASAQTLDNNLVTLGMQHMDLTDAAVDAALDGNKDASAIGAQLYANGNNIGAAVGSVYGSSAQSTFDQVWKLHLDQFVAYAEADAKGDSNAKQAALNTINTGYTIPLAKFLANANPNLPENTVQTLLSQHVAMTAQIIDDHVQGNYQKEASDLNSADQMITKIFSTLAGAIAKQYPSKFSS